MYLVDTNVFLEGLLEQKKVEIVRAFFQLVDLDEIYITDLALHSMGIILFKLKKPELFNSFEEITGQTKKSPPPPTKAFVYKLGDNRFRGFHPILIGHWIQNPAHEQYGAGFDVANKINERPIDGDSHRG